MKNENKYNGWSNYATWRINLEIFDGYEAVEDDCINAEMLEEMAEEHIFQGFDRYADTPPLMQDYARAFIADVNWQEIAEHITSEFSEEYKA